MSRRDTIAALLAEHRLMHSRPAMPGPGEAWHCSCGIFRVTDSARIGQATHVADVIDRALDQDKPRRVENWNPNTAGPSCDWCGECDWCTHQLDGDEPRQDEGGDREATATSFSWGAVVEDSTAAYWTPIAPEVNVWVNYREGMRRLGEIDVVRIVTRGVAAMPTSGHDDREVLARLLYDNAGFHAADQWGVESSIVRGRYEAAANAVLAWMRAEGFRRHPEKPRGRGSFWTPAEWADWSDSLAELLPEEYDGDAAQEALIERALADLVGRAGEEPEGTTITEWGVRWSPEHGVWLRVSRQRTTYPDRVTDWTEVSDD